MYRYAEVQDVLAKLHGAYPDHVGALRGRLQHFQKLGMVPASPGRGRVISYTFHDIARWAFGLELIEVGIDPARIALLMSWLWLLVGDVLCGDHQGEKVFIAYPAMLITQMTEQEAGITKGPGGFVHINVMDTAPPRFVYDVEELANWRPARAVLVNLTDLRTRLVKALQDIEVDKAYASG